MIRIFDLFKRPRTDSVPFVTGSYFDSNVTTADLQLLINHAITVFEQRPGAGAELILDEIKQFRNDEDLAVALFRFIPAAYCRLLLKEPTYPDAYIVKRSPQEQTSYHYFSDKVFRLIMDISKQRIEQAATREKLLSPLCHSAEFDAINKAQADGAKLSNLHVAPSCFIEYAYMQKNDTMAVAL